MSLRGCLSSLRSQATCIPQGHQRDKHTLRCRYESKGCRFWTGKTKQRRAVSLSSHNQSGRDSRVLGPRICSYALYGQLTEKSDVYSFGIVILGTMCRRKALDQSRLASSSWACLITDWAWSLIKEGKMDQVLDSALLEKGELSGLNPRGVMERFVLVGILCSHVMVASRPTILDALKMLEGDIEVPRIPGLPKPLGPPSFVGDADNFT
ncbi:hypothetical protein Ancab_026893 [Ancistrocladus abbreviatus]